MRIAWALVVSATLAASRAARSDLILTVDTTQDGVDANPGDGVCATSGGKCTLRAAVMESNHTASGTVEVRVPANASPYVLTIPPSGLDDEASGQLLVTREVTITGGGAAHTIVDGNAADRVFVLHAPTTLSGLTIRNGSVAGSGGAIFGDGATITLSRCVVTTSSAHGGGGAGGGIMVSSGRTLVLDRCTVNGNFASAEGGGVSAFGAATISDSTISDNVAGLFAGGLDFPGSGSQSILYSTIAGNLAGTDAGGTGAGGGIYSYGGLATVVGSVIAGNFESIPNKPFPPIISPSDCKGFFPSTNNIVGTKSHCTITALVADPLLAPLRLNGGELPTRALLTGSPAIDPVVSTPCELAPPTDQRGAHRPSGSGCDLGAYEYAANGDVNGDGKRDVADVFYLVNFLFAGGTAPLGLGDVNGDTATDVSDFFSLINFLFAGGSAPL